jgi:hypothetical protein
MKNYANKLSGKVSIFAVTSLMYLGITAPFVSAEVLPATVLPIAAIAALGMAFLQDPKKVAAFRAEGNLGMVIMSMPTSGTVTATVDFSDVLAKIQEAKDQVEANGTSNTTELQALGTSLSTISATLDGQPTAANLTAAKDAIIAALDQQGIIDAVTSAGGGIEADIVAAKDAITSTLDNNYISLSVKQDAIKTAVDAVATAVADAQSAIVTAQNSTNTKLDALQTAANNATTDRGTIIGHLADISAESTLIKGGLADILAEFDGLLSKDDSAEIFAVEFQREIDSRTGSGKAEAGVACIVTIPDGWLSQGAVIMSHLTPNKEMKRRIRLADDSGWGAWASFGQGTSSGDAQGASGFDMYKRKQIQYWFPAQTVATIAGFASSALTVSVGLDTDVDYEVD